jgi:hypothetical protein
MSTGTSTVAQSVMSTSMIAMTTADMIRLRGDIRVDGSTERRRDGAIATRRQDRQRSRAAMSTANITTSARRLA